METRRNESRRAFLQNPTPFFFAFRARRGRWKMAEKLLGFPFEAISVRLPKVGVGPTPSRDDAVIDET